MLPSLFRFMFSITAPICPIFESFRRKAPAVQMGLLFFLELLQSCQCDGSMHSWLGVNLVAVDCVKLEITKHYIFASLISQSLYVEVLGETLRLYVFGCYLYT